jgi:hypothetical protein
VNQVVQGAPKALGAYVAYRQSSSTLQLGVEWQGHFVGDVETPSSVEKLLSGGGIKVTKGAWRVPK